MANSKPTIEEKLRISALSALIFLVVSSPLLYKIVSAVLGSWVATQGCPTLAGLLLHTVVCGAVVFGLMFTDV